VNSSGSRKTSAPTDLDFGVSPAHTHKRGEGRREGTRTASHNQEEQERKAKHATKQNQPAAMQLKQDSKGKEQTHSWEGERGDRVGGKGRKSEAEREMDPAILLYPGPRRKRERVRLGPMRILLGLMATSPL